MRTRKAFEGPGDGEVVFAGEVDADVEVAAVGAEDLRGAGFEGFGALAGLDEVVGEEDAGLIEEFAIVFLGEGFGIGEAALEERDVDGEAIADGVVDGDFLAREYGRAGGRIRN
jgi:hypothetical protein